MRIRWVIGQPDDTMQYRKAHVVCVMHIVHHQDDRVLLGHRGHECMGRLGEPDTRCVSLAFEGRREHREALPHCGNGLRQFRERIGWRCRGTGTLGQLGDESRDHGVGDLALHLMTLHPCHGGPLEPRRRGEPLHQRALADAGVTEQQPVPRRPALGPLPRLVQLAILAAAPDEGPPTPLISAHCGYVG